MQAKFVKREKKKKMRKKLSAKRGRRQHWRETRWRPSPEITARGARAGPRGVEDEGATNEKDCKFANALQKAREVTDKKILQSSQGTAGGGGRRTRSRARAQSEHGQ